MAAPTPYRSPPVTLRLAPRRVPFGVCVHALLGNRLSQFGFAALALLLFDGSRDEAFEWTHFSPYGHAGHVTTGTILETYESPNQSCTIWITYQFVDQHGKEQKRTEERECEPASKPGDAIAIQHTDEGYARIAKEPRETLVIGPARRLLVLWPIPFFFMCIGFGWGWPAYKFLKHGTVGWGRLLARRETGEKRGDKVEWELTFEFEVAGRRYQPVVTTFSPQVLEDEELEQLVYDPRNPMRVRMMDQLPGRPRIDAEGALAAPHPRRTAAYLLLPAVALLLTALTIGLMVVGWTAT